jgi:16S rRNA (adenine(1408)-N(1))-methyltransferase
VEYIRGKTSAEIDADGLAARVAGYGEVLIDVGTGDGRYVLHVARTRPTCFAIGVDACRDNLRKVSRKAPPNALYVIANALALPGELSGMASKVTINFPWGSLLTGPLDGEPMLLEGLLAIARPGAALEVSLNRGALAESGYTLENGSTRVRRALREGGFDVGELLWLDARELRQCHTTWAKRLAYGRDPRVVRLRAMLAGDAGTRVDAYMANGALHEALNGHQRFRIYTHSEPRFRALLLTEGNAKVLFHREVSG